MYYDFQVEIPEAKGKIITKKKGSVTYVLYQYGQEYKSEKRYAIPKRAIIGKVSSENSSMMFRMSSIRDIFLMLSFRENEMMPTAAAVFA